MATRNKQTRVYLWSALALAFAMLFTGGYTGWKVITGYRDHRDALAGFGRNVRHEAEAHHWRYEVVSGKDEALLLYLQKTRFIKPADAITEWNSGNLDALVVSKEKALAVMDEFKSTDLSLLESKKRKQRDQRSGYVLITR